MSGEEKRKRYWKVEVAERGQEEEEVERGRRGRGTEKREWQRGDRGRMSKREEVERGGMGKGNRREEREAVGRGCGGMRQKKGKTREGRGKGEEELEKWGLGSEERVGGRDRRKGRWWEGLREEGKSKREQKVIGGKEIANTKKRPRKGETRGRRKR